MAKAIHVANYLISMSVINSERSITPLKLQKLLYFVQTSYYQRYRKTLFDEKVVYLKSGPFIESVYDEYKHHGYFSIPKDSYDFSDSISTLTNQEKEVIENLFKHIGHLDGKFLEELFFMEDLILFYSQKNSPIDFNNIEKIENIS